ncbi:MAG: UDP-glucose 4-epimerase GalE [Clostridia bacterium]|nr:UDP-glucose 4-epimerase GalE [Clostridia bacterium]MBQ7043444.1 UDP-glucose 4-epimerase GalE [Clostridia bacterium]
MKILVTGGAGYIGSHTCVEMLNAGHEIVIVDNFYNSCPESLNRIRELTGKDFLFYECDIRDREGLDKIFAENKIDAVIHFAGLKAVGESCAKPLEYYENNVGGTITLCEAMRDAGCKKIVFSSSATVYGENNPSPLKETMQIGGTTNPYGTTKYMIELILRDLWASDNEWSIALLRYFNPIGAHKSGRIGENPNGIPNNLMPYITQVAVGKLACLSVFGDDYDTHDGTGVRDYIHVVDLALGHVKAVEKVLSGTGVDAYNLGTGNGYSVLDIVHAFEKACGKPLNYKIVDRRPGDLATCYSDPTKAFEILGWKAERGLDEMCEDSWRWQKNNPEGY